jgi:hypothetical protein
LRLDCFARQFAMTGCRATSTHSCDFQPLVPRTGRA